MIFIVGIVVVIGEEEDKRERERGEREGDRWEMRGEEGQGVD